MKNLTTKQEDFKMLGKNSKLDPESKDFDYEEWRKSQKIKPSLEVTIAVKEPEEEDEEEDEEYKNFKKENKIKSVKEALQCTGKKSI